MYFDRPLAVELGHMIPLFIYLDHLRITGYESHDRWRGRQKISQTDKISPNAIKGRQFVVTSVTFLLHQLYSFFFFNLWRSHRPRGYLQWIQDRARLNANVMTVSKMMIPILEINK